MKTALFVNQTGDITAGVTYGTDVNSFQITDPSLFKSLKVEGLDSGDRLYLMQENYAGTGWEYYTDGGGVVEINRNQTTVCPVAKGTFALQGKVSGTVTAYTEE